MKCSKCGKEISGHPCVFCGSGGPGGEGAVLLVGGMFLVVMLLVFVPWGDPGEAGTRSSERAWQPTEMGAFGACQDFVERRLVSPSTADWPTQSTADISRSGDEFRVQTHVDSENRMGGTVRSEVDCTVEPSGDRRWRSVELVIESR